MVRLKVRMNGFWLDAGHYLTKAAAARYALGQLGLTLADIELTPA